jgi:hypothetical protein
LARKFIQFKVGDGKNILMWLDWWHLDGVLYEKYVHRIVYNTGSKVREKLSSVLKEKNLVLATGKI